MTRLDNAFRDVDQVAHNVGLAVKVPKLGEFHVSHFTGYRLNKAFYLWWGGGNNVELDPAKGLDPSESETWEIGWKAPSSQLVGASASRHLPKPKSGACKVPEVPKNLTFSTSTNPATSIPAAD